MKKVLFILGLLFIFYTPINCQTYTSKSFLYVKNNLQKYINQPLGLLLSDIENDIKKASVIRPNISLNRPSKFQFFDITHMQFDSLFRNRGKYSTIVVTVKDKLYYNYSQQGIYEFKDWPRDDIEKFKSIIIFDIYVVD